MTGAVPCFACILLLAEQSECGNSALRTKCQTDAVKVGAIWTSVSVKRGERGLLMVLE